MSFQTKKKLNFSLESVDTLLAGKKLRISIFGQFTSKGIAKPCEKMGANVLQKITKLVINYSSPQNLFFKISCVTPLPQSRISSASPAAHQPIIAAKSCSMCNSAASQGCLLGRISNIIIAKCSMRKILANRNSIRADAE